MSEISRGATVRAGSSLVRPKKQHWVRHTTRSRSRGGMAVMAPNIPSHPMGFEHGGGQNRLVMWLPISCSKPRETHNLAGSSTSSTDLTLRRVSCMHGIAIARLITWRGLHKRETLAWCATAMSSRCHRCCTVNIPLGSIIQPRGPLSSVRSCLSNGLDRVCCAVEFSLVLAKLFCSNTPRIVLGL